MTPEIRSVLFVTIVAVLAACLISCEPDLAPQAHEDLLGQAESFTTRRVPARAFLTND